MREATAYEDTSDCVRDEVEEVEAPPGDAICVRVSLGESCGLGRPISLQFMMQGAGEDKTWLRGIGFDAEG